MTYNVSYTSLPTLMSNSIGYTLNHTGIKNYSAGQSGNIIFDNFELNSGVYMLNVNAIGLLKNSATGIYWYCNITTIDNQSLLFSPHLTGNYYSTEIHLCIPITISNATTIYISAECSGSGAVLADGISYINYVTRIT